MLLFSLFLLWRGNARGKMKHSNFSMGLELIGVNRHPFAPGNPACPARHREPGIVELSKTLYAQTAKGVSLACAACCAVAVLLLLATPPP